MPDGLQLIDSEDRPAVLIVDDETDVRGAYAALRSDVGFGRPVLETA